MLLPETLRAMADAFGDEVAYSLVDGGSLTFAEWDGQASRLARGLVANGVKAGDRVAVHISPPNALRWLVAYAAVHRAGGVAVPLNTRLSPAEVGRMLEHSGAVAAVADGERVVADSAGPVSIVVDASVSTVPEPAGPREANRRRRASVIGWDSALDPDASPIQVPRADDDLADILYTSGTTGNPKGVAVRHANAALMPAGPPSWSGRGWLHASPMWTFAGMAFVYNPMKLGLSGIYMPQFDAGRWLEVVHERRPTAVFLVPSMAHLLLGHPGFEGADLSSVTLCSIGSAPLAPFVIERLQEKMPDAMVSNNYGMTEAGSVYCLTPRGESVRRPGSVGQPAPPAKVSIVGEDGAELPVGSVGEIRLKIPGRPREYYGDPEGTARTWIDGWLVTGDLGRLDEDGYLYIVGRSKDVIIRGGNNIHAADVEHVIVAHPDVREAAVIGVPHDVLGEDLVAYVVRRPHSPVGPVGPAGPAGEGGEGSSTGTVRRGNGSDEGGEVTAGELREHCLKELADYKVPRQWRFVEELPRNSTGKVVKPELLRRYEEEARAK